MNAHLYIEGADSKEDQIRCRQGFRKLLEKAGFTGRMPRLTASGSRNSAFGDFKTALANAEGRFVAMLIDSEDPVAEIEKTWAHLKSRDNWDKPSDAADDQVLFMSTCMESWIVADRETLRQHYGHKLKENSLPRTSNLESQSRTDVHDKLVLATRECSNAYKKGRRSFVVVGGLNPAALLPLLPSFARVNRILDQKL